MPIVLVRVDCRLVHGQVMETWVPHTGANCLLVASDALDANPFMRSVMEIAVPSSIHVVFRRVDDVADALAEIDRKNERAILLCAALSDALRIFRAGVRFPGLNVGNLHFAEGKVEVTPSVYFAPEDFEAVDALSRLGVAVTVRSTPFEPAAPYRRCRGG
ncbi:MAG: PTS sugar transporter subunit IIB [Deltaproteobacteria bacterium]